MFKDTSVMEKPLEILGGGRRGGADAMVSHHHHKYIVLCLLDSGDIDLKKNVIQGVAIWSVIKSRFTFLFDELKQLSFLSLSILSRL